MNLLLDTQALVWTLIDPAELSQQAREQVAEAANHVFVSVISPWELAIKLSIRKLPMTPNLADWLPSSLSQLGLTLMPVELRHAIAVEHLPLHHRDPFDRLLIAQAQVERLTVVTRDRHFADYDVPVLWA